MSKAWKDILCGLWINCNHILCHAHIIALAGTAWRHSLNEVDRCVSQIKSILAKEPARRSRFIPHLESCGVTSPTLPPQPVITRWNSWFEAFVYHSSLLPHYSAYIANERREELDTLALQQLSSLLEIPTVYWQFTFVAKHCNRLMAVLNLW